MTPAGWILTICIATILATPLGVVAIILICDDNSNQTERLTGAGLAAFVLVLLVIIVTAASQLGHAECVQRFRDANVKRALAGEPPRTGSRYCSLP